MIYWGFYEMVSYGVLPWILFFAISFATAFFFHIPGILFGHVLIAIIVGQLDLQWIQAEMDAPGWDGQPDQDVVFIAGMLIRIVLVNTLLVPVSLVALSLRRLRHPRKQQSELVAHTDD